MTRQSIEYCGWFDTSRSKPISSAISQRLGDLGGLPLADADVQHLALADEVVEGPQRLLERRLVVEAVRLVEVDVVGLQPLQRGVAGLDDVLAGQTALVRAGTGRPVDLREQLVGLAPLRPSAPRRARSRPCVPAYTSAVSNVVMPTLEGLAHAGRGLLGLHLRAVGQPVAVADLADLQAAAPQAPVLHAGDPRRTRQRPGDAGGGPGSAEAADEAAQHARTRTWPCRAAAPRGTARLTRPRSTRGDHRCPPRPPRGRRPARRGTTSAADAAAWTKVHDEQHDGRERHAASSADVAPGVDECRGRAGRTGPASRGAAGGFVPAQARLLDALRVLGRLARSWRCAAALRSAGAARPGRGAGCAFSLRLGVGRPLPVVGSLDGVVTGSGQGEHLVERGLRACAAVSGSTEIWLAPGPRRAPRGPTRGGAGRCGSWSSRSRPSSRGRPPSCRGALGEPAARG